MTRSIRLSLPLPTAPDHITGVQLGWQRRATAEIANQAPADGRQTLAGHARLRVHVGIVHGRPLIGHRGYPGRRPPGGGPSRHLRPRGPLGQDRGARPGPDQARTRRASAAAHRGSDAPAGIGAHEGTLGSCSRWPAAAPARRPTPCL
jgi:hypothetical protein